MTELISHAAVIDLGYRMSDGGVSTTLPTNLSEAMVELQESLAEYNAGLPLTFGNPGIAIAAPQIGRPWNMFYVDIDGRIDDEVLWGYDDPVMFEGEPITKGWFIRTTIEQAEDAVMVKHPEGCLSAKEMVGIIERPSRIRFVSFYAPEPTDKLLSFVGIDQFVSGYMARVYQHENDHFVGQSIITKSKQTLVENEEVK